jgi:hypothetical protein
MRAGQIVGYPGANREQEELLVIQGLGRIDSFTYVPKSVHILFEMSHSAGFALAQ